MRAIPVDTDRVLAAYIDATPVVEYDRTTGEVTDNQRANLDGIPLWKLGVLVIVAGEPGGTAIRVNVPMDDKPSWPELTRIELEGMMAVPWSRDGKHGVSYTATTARPLAAPGSRSKPAPEAQTA